MEPEIKKVKSKGKLFYPITHADGVIGLNQIPNLRSITEEEYWRLENTDLNTFYITDKGCVYINNTPLCKQSYIVLYYDGSTNIPGEYGYSEEIWKSFQKIEVILLDGTVYTYSSSDEYKELITSNTGYDSNIDKVIIYVDPEFEGDFSICDSNTYDRNWFCTKIDASNFTNYNVTSIILGGTSCSEIILPKVKFNKLTSLKEAFSCNTNLSKITNFDSLNTSNVTDMSNMFASCTNSSLTSFPYLDTSNVTNMLGMFGGYKGINYLDLSNFNTSKVTNMANMFTYCTAKTLNLSSFDISNVTSFSNMFLYASVKTIICKTSFRDWVVENWDNGLCINSFNYGSSPADSPGWLIVD